MTRKVTTKSSQFLESKSKYLQYLQNEDTCLLIKDSFTPAIPYSTRSFVPSYEHDKLAKSIPA